MMWTLPVSSKGQITLPLALRDFMGIAKAPAKVTIEKSETGAVLRTLSPYKLSDLYGIAKQKKAEKDTEKLISEGIEQMAEEISREGTE